jgi:hypothetical protein
MKNYPPVEQIGEATPAILNSASANTRKKRSTLVRLAYGRQARAVNRMKNVIRKR